MASVKERIAALQNRSQNDTSKGHTAEYQRPVVKESTGKETKIQSIQSRIAAAQRSTLHTAMSEKEKLKMQNAPSRSKVSALAQNMKGLDMKAMLSGHRGVDSKTSSWKKESVCRSTIAGSNQLNRNIDHDTMMEIRHMKRAVIGHGRRRPRTIPSSLQGIKFSTE